MDCKSADIIVWRLEVFFNIGTFTFIVLQVSLPSILNQSTNSLIGQLYLSPGTGQYHTILPCIESIFSMLPTFPFSLFLLLKRNNIVWAFISSHCISLIINWKIHVLFEKRYSNCKAITIMLIISIISWLRKIKACKFLWLG